VREQFYSLGDLLGYYRFLKYKMAGCASNFPDEQRLQDYTKKFDPVFQQSTKEDIFCFIGDVENFIKYFYRKQNYYFPVPMNCLYLIFLQKFCSDISKFQSYGHLALHFHKRIKRGDNLPRRLKYPQHLNDISHQMKKQAEDYFIKKGYSVVTTLL
jgi:hypothetical protein